MNCQRGPSDKIASGQLRVENKLRVITTSTTMLGNEAKNVSADADGRPTADTQQAPHHPLANQRDGFRRTLYVPLLFWVFCFHLA